MGRIAGFDSLAGNKRSIKKLIKAAADYAKDKGDPPPQLSYRISLQNWGALPIAGGMNDQDARQIYTMDTLYSVYLSVLAWRSGHPSNDQIKTIGWLIKNDLM